MRDFKSFSLIILISNHSLFLSKQHTHTCTSLALSLMIPSTQLVVAQTPSLSNRGAAVYHIYMSPQDFDPPLPLPHSLSSSSSSSFSSSLLQLDVYINPLSTTTTTTSQQYPFSLPHLIVLRGFSSSSSSSSLSLSLSRISEIHKSLWTETYTNMRGTCIVFSIVLWIQQHLSELLRSPLPLSQSSSSSSSSSSSLSLTYSKQQTHKHTHKHTYNSKKLHKYRPLSQSGE